MVTRRASSLYVAGGDQLPVAADPQGWQVKSLEHPTAARHTDAKALLLLVVYGIHRSGLEEVPVTPEIRRRPDAQP